MSVYSSGTVEYGDCPVCGREISVTKRGVMRWHVNLDKPSSYRHGDHMMCEGVGQPPKRTEAGAA